MDKSKVIKGLTQCSTYWNQAWDSPEDCPCNKCPYKPANANCRIALSADALKVIVAYEKALVPLLRQAFKELFPTWEDVKKDEQWYRLYNLYQVTRYALHEAENPEGKGVDSYPPWNAGGVDEPMPKCTFTADSENPLTSVKISKPTFKEDSRE